MRPSRLIGAGSLVPFSYLRGTFMAHHGAGTGCRGLTGFVISGKSIAQTSAKPSNGAPGSGRSAQHLSVSHAIAGLR